MRLNLFLILISSLLKKLAFAIPNDCLTGQNIFQLPNLGFEIYKNVSALDITVTMNNYIEPQCWKQLQAIQNGLLTNQLWSLKFIDSWGKIPSGIFYENLVDMGNYDECVSIAQNDFIMDTNIRGKYCLAKISLNQIYNSTKITQLQIGICIPAACKAQYLRKPMEASIRKLSNSFTNDEIDDMLWFEDKECKTAEIKPFEVIDWIAIFVLTLLAVFMVASTTYDYLTTHCGKPVHPLWASFSVRSNMRQLFHISSYKNAPHIVPCLNGIRSLSTIWIVFLHIALKIIPAPAINQSYFHKFFRSLFSNIFQQGTIVVDTFFFISGLLLISVAFRQMEKNAGRINIPLMYFHRILRLTPVLALALLMHMSLDRYVSDGPLRKTIDQDCLDSWWATLLYVQNYVCPATMCLGHVWYLAVDMQLYIISPLILLAIWKWNKKAIWVLTLIGLILTLLSIAIIVTMKLNVFNTFGFGTLPDRALSLTYMHFPTHMRSIPWIIGIIFGYYLYRLGGKRANLSKCTITIGWICAIFLILIPLFGIHHDKQMLDVPVLTPWKGALYLSLSHIAWPLGTAWVVFACINGFGGPINKFLSSPLWQPLSKLSYCLYIFHFEVVGINMERIKTNIYISNYDAILYFWSTYGISLTISFVIYLAVELPMANIDQLLFRRKSSK